MSLIFHDRSDAPAVQGLPFLTIERGGNFSLNAATVQALKLTIKQPVLLVQDAATNAWYLYLGAQPGTQPFMLRARDSKKSRAMLFGSTSRAKAYYAAHGLDTAKVPSVRLSVQVQAVQVQGLTLYPLLTPQHATAAPAPVAKAKKTTAPELNPEAEVTTRIRRQVQELGGLDLRKVTDATLTRALGLLTQYPDLLPSIPGATRLLEKLEAHFSPAQ